MPIEPSAPLSDGQTLEYRGFHFDLGASPTQGGYRPTVALVPPAELRVRPSAKDTDETAYGTEVEAIRHAEQQEMRWVHDRTGTDACEPRSREQPPTTQYCSLRAITPTIASVATRWKTGYGTDEGGVGRGSQA